MSLAGMREWIGRALAAARDGRTVPYKAGETYTVTNEESLVFARTTELVLLALNMHEQGERQANRVERPTKPKPRVRPRQLIPGQRIVKQERTAGTTNRPGRTRRAEQRQVRMDKRDARLAARPNAPAAQIIETNGEVDADLEAEDSE